MQANTSVAFTTATVSGAGTTLAADCADYLRCIPGSMSLELVLPVVAQSQGRRVTVRNFSTSHNVLLNTAESNGDTEDAETIEGSPDTFTLGPLDRVTLQCISGGWESV